MSENGMKAIVVATLAIAAQAGCTPSEEKLPGRWYTASQIERGRTVFSTQCATCHGENAKGTADWSKPDADGKYPPPPLDGSAHAWHHPMAVLIGVIEKGGARFGGTMPGFSGKLDENQITDVIAFFQSLWPDETYARWHEIDSRAQR